MVVYYGLKRKLKIDKKLGFATCPNCGYDTEQAVAHETGYVHIYYIPVFPLFGWKVKVCSNCGVIEKLDKNAFKALKAN